MNLRRFRRDLLGWYAANARDLPWRRTRDAYAIWLSEVMLQQTRVVAVIPYYEKFLRLFPTVDALAAAPEGELLAAWAGLGYYSRARNLQRAARDIEAQGGFPSTYEGIAALPGVGAYTAAAVASIAFDLPHAAVDGNVLRVIARLDADSGDIASAAVKQRLSERADELMDVGRPAAWNQAMMELGATVCTPRKPQCLVCPVRAHCEGQAQGIADTLPTKTRKQRRETIHYSIALARKQGSVFFVQRGGNERRLAGFWELPRVDELSGFRATESLGQVRHAITFNDFCVEVIAGSLPRAPKNGQWIAPGEWAGLPLTTLSKKALALAVKQSGTEFA